MNRLPRRRPPLPSRAWAWLLAAMFVLQAAVPMLAATVATRRGVNLAEVCSHYGVRTALPVALADAPAAPDDAPSPAPGPHGSPMGCALTPLLAGAALASAAGVAPLPAPPPATFAASTPAVSPVADAAQRWLTQRLHAPPVPA